MRPPGRLQRLLRRFGAHSSDSSACALLYVGSLALDLLLVSAINRQRILTGEEATVSFLDVVFHGLRLQHNRFCSNIGGHTLFYLASHLVGPHISLFYGRVIKALLMGFVGPLAFLFARWRLRLRAGPAFLAAAFLVLLPGVTAFSWIAIEAGLDLVLGVAALLLLTSEKPLAWIAGGAALGFAVITYPGAFVFVPACGLSVLSHLVRRPTPAALTMAAASLAALVAMLVYPYLWWTNTHHVFLGGGRVGWDSGRLLHLFHELSLEPRSYYFFSVFPALGHWAIFGLSALALLLSARDWRRHWLLWTCLATTVLVYGFSGGEIGYRRVVALSFLAAMFLGSLLDTLSRSPGWRRWVGTVASAVVLATLATMAVRTARDYRKGRVSLPIDYDFPRLAPGGMADNLRAVILAPDPAREIAALREPMRVMCMAHLLQRRSEFAGRPAAFTVPEIRDYYLSKDTEKLK